MWTCDDCGAKAEGMGGGWPPRGWTMTSSMASDDFGKPRGDRKPSGGSIRCNRCHIIHEAKKGEAWALQNLGVYAERGEAWAKSALATLPTAPASPRGPA
jgi:hypothetical protein